MWIDQLILKECAQPFSLKVWIPDETIVVVGKSNDADRECYRDHCLQDNVPILRRSGGGGAVVLHPACIVIGLGCWVKSFYQNDLYFSKINSAIIKTLGFSYHALSELYQDGISDLVFKGKKVAGTSMFRSRNYLLYQASLLFEGRVDLMDRYLQHPSREPSYRRGKIHSDFLGCFSDILPHVSISEMQKNLQTQLPGFLNQELDGELLGMVSEQLTHIQAKSMENTSIGASFSA